MDYRSLDNNMKYLSPNGVTLNVDERMRLKLALNQLQCEIPFEELLLWGKIEGKFSLTSHPYRLPNRLLRCCGRKLSWKARIRRQAILLVLRREYDFYKVASSLEWHMQTFI